ncbi:MAG: hypothetical protein AB7G06_00190 [Bdellovibrionales bacterium]
MSYSIVDLRRLAARSQKQDIADIHAELLRLARAGRPLAPIIGLLQDNPVLALNIMRIMAANATAESNEVQVVLDALHDQKDNAGLIKFVALLRQAPSMERPALVRGIQSRHVQMMLSSLVHLGGDPYGNGGRWEPYFSDINWLVYLMNSAQNCLYDGCRTAAGQAPENGWSADGKRRVAVDLRQLELLFYPYPSLRGIAAAERAERARQESVRRAAAGQEAVRPAIIIGSSEEKARAGSKGEPEPS